MNIKLNSPITVDGITTEVARSWGVGLLFGEARTR